MICGAGIFLYTLSRTQTASPEVVEPVHLTGVSKLEHETGGAIKKKAPPKKPVTLIAVGDIMLSRDVDTFMKKYGGYDYPYEKVRSHLQSADITFGNLETPLTPGRTILTEEMSFRADVENAEALKDAGFSILSLANNHTPNFGDQGLYDTFEYLTKAKIKYVGAGKESGEAHKPQYIKKNGYAFAFLAYNDTDVVPSSYGAGSSEPGTALMDIETMETSVKKAKKDADFVIVSMHSGTEYVQYPNTSQASFAEAAIDAGAELVIGHHPHVVQTVDKYKGKYIIYSLGNFIFDQAWSLNTQQGMTVKIRFDNDEVSKISFRPIQIYSWCQPDFLEGSAGDAVLARLEFDD
ncbi:CapA family protein [Patescibacteria group bacterium]